jgi:putative transposase
VKRAESVTSAAPGGRRPYLGDMPRPHRPQIADGIYHLTARGNRRQPIFLDDDDRRKFLDLLGIVVLGRGWHCHAYCLMPNHYHLVVQTPNPDLSRGMQHLNARYAEWFNWRHGVDGHLFQGRFHSVLVESDWHLLELARYLVLNPVRARLCEGPADWAWSSYGPALGTIERPPFLTLDWLLGRFGSDRDGARAAFARFVADAPPAVAA